MGTLGGDSGPAIHRKITAREPARGQESWPAQWNVTECSDERFPVEEDPGPREYSPTDVL